MPADVSIPAPGDRPTHVVVFRRAGVRPIQAMARSMHLQLMDPSDPRPGVMVLLEASGLVRVVAYRRFGAAVATLTEEQAAEMARLQDVAGVYCNDIRSIPRPVEDLPPTPPGRDTVAMAAPPVPATTHSWCLDLVGIPATYAKATGAGIRVAVLDTGIDRNHPDFAGRIQAYRNFAKGSGDDDLVRHGTHCAGIVAGAAKAAGGVRYGVAPEAQLIVGKVLDDSGSGFDNDILEGLDWAIDEGAHIVSMSLGSVRGVGQDYARAYELIAKNLLDATPGVLMIAAAGNESRRDLGRVNPVGNPAACPSVLAVAAVDRAAKVAYFSCGQVDSIGAIDVSAPGVDVLSAVPGGGTRLLSGTSMATPHVAGVAALWAQRFPKASARTIWRKLTAAAKPLGAAADTGSGLLQAP